LGIASDNVVNDLGPVAAEMEELLLKAGLPEAEIKELTAALSQMAAQAPQTALAMDNANGAFDRMNKNTISVS
jgi:hypothetical protein